MSYINILKEKLFSTRIALFVALLLGNTGWAMADNTLSIADFEIKAGEQKEVAVELNNTSTDIGSIEADIELPTGLKAVEYSKGVSAKGKRGAMSAAYNFSTKHIGIVSMSKFSGTSGVLVTFMVEASTDLAATSEIKLTNVVARHKDADKTKESLADVKATVTRTDAGGGGSEDPDPETPETLEAALQFTSPSLTMKGGEEVNVTVDMTNKGEFTGISGVVTATTGVAITGVTGSERFSGSLNFNSSTGKISSFGGIDGTSGELLTITLKADESFDGEATVTVKDVVLSTSNATVKVKPANVTLTVTVEAAEPGPEPEVPTAAIAFSPATVTMNGGETADVEVQLTNSAEFTGLSGSMTVSEGVTIESVSFSDRLSDEPNYSNETGKMMGLTAIIGTEGTIFTVKLKAADDFSGTATLSLKDFTFSTSNASIKAKAADAEQTITVTAAPEPEVPTAAITLSPATVTMNGGATADVEVQLTNSAEFTGLSGSMKVSEGVTIESVTFSDRLSDEPNYNSETGKMLGLTAITGTEGTLFTVKLKAADDFSGTATLSLKDFTFSTSNASIKAKAADVEQTITVTKDDDGTKAAADKMIDDVQKELDDAKKEIAEKYPDVAADYEKAAADIQKEIEGLQGDVDKEFADNNTVDTEAVKTKADAISKEIADMKADAAKAQEAADKKKANDEAYKKLSDELKALQKQLDDANTEIANDYLDAAADESIQAEAAAIQKKIDDARTALEAKNKKGELTAESKNEGTESVPADIAQLLKDAKAAQAAADELKDEEAKKKANEDAYKKLSKELDDLQKDLDNAKEEIEFKYPDAADDENILKQEADIQKKIDDARDALENKYKNGELMAASENEGVETVPADIIKLLNDAKAVQDAASDDDPDELYKEWNKALNDLYTEYRSSKSFIAENYPAANADEDIQKREQDIYQEIFDARELVKKLHKKGQLTEESEIADTKAIHEEIVQLLKDAADIQAVADNEIAYQSALEKVEGLQKKLDEAKETIKEDCPDVAADYDDDAAQIQKEIDDLKAFIDEQYEDGKFFIDPGVNTDPINRKIEEMLDNAKKAQEAFTPDVPPTAVNGVKQIDGAVAYYDLNGKRIAKTVKGKVVIVKMADGTLRKQAIK